jgi:hypothetical protein
LTVIQDIVGIIIDYLFDSDSNGCNQKRNDKPENPAPGNTHLIFHGMIGRTWSTNVANLTHCHMNAFHLHISTLLLIIVDSNTFERLQTKASLG